MVKRTSQPLVVVVSGAPGIGKTSAIEIACRHVRKSVHLPVDDIRWYVRGGYVSPCHWSRAVRAQYHLAHMNTIALAKNFLQAGYTVFVDDVFYPSWQRIFRKHLGTAAHFVLLRSSLRTALHRVGRRKARTVSPTVVRRAFRALYGQKNFERSWIVIDTEQLTVRDVAQRLVDITRQLRRERLGRSAADMRSKRP